jgi:Fur family ferric uptake transcriptional regulator
VLERRAAAKNSERSTVMTADFSLGHVEVSLSPQERFEEFLQSRDKRMTQQRRAIVDLVFSHHEHFDAEELLTKLKETAGDRKVSRPTVYRTLSELVDAGLLVKMDIGGRSVYEHDYGYPDHDHLLCQKCNKLIEFHSDETIRIRDAVARQHQFRVQGHRLIVYGICTECQRLSRRPSRKLDRV